MWLYCVKGTGTIEGHKSYGTSCYGTSCYCLHIIFTPFKCCLSVVLSLAKGAYPENTCVVSLNKRVCFCFVFSISCVCILLH